MKKWHYEKISMDWRANKPPDEWKIYEIDYDGTEKHHITVGQVFTSEEDVKEICSTHNVEVDRIKYAGNGLG